MERRLVGASGLGVEDAMALLASHEAGDVPGWERMTGDCLAQSISVQSVVVDAERQAVWISVGSAPTSKGPWHCVPWQWERGGPEARIIEAPLVDHQAPDGTFVARDRHGLGELTHEVEVGDGRNRTASRGGHQSSSLASRSR